MDTTLKPPTVHRPATEAILNAWLKEALPLAVLGAIALVAAGFLLRNDLFIYGENPGHYWQMWFTLNVELRVHHQLVGWNPYW